MIVNESTHGLLVIDLERTLDTVKHTKTVTELVNIRHTFRELLDSNSITVLMYQNVNSMVRWRVDYLKGRC